MPVIPSALLRRDKGDPCSRLPQSVTVSRLPLDVVGHQLLRIVPLLLRYAVSGPADPLDDRIILHRQSPQAVPVA